MVTDHFPSFLVSVRRHLKYRRVKQVACIDLLLNVNLKVIQNFVIKLYLEWS